MLKYVASTHGSSTNIRFIVSMKHIFVDEIIFRYIFGVNVLRIPSKIKMFREKHGPYRGVQLWHQCVASKLTCKKAKSDFHCENR